ncbi:uncharacterized protein LTR77_008850 [Saxophila tyrrhenica]|uniref:UBC core domain-containing protein n=1 Tax=Saxophila tyrrhenica TaxID=1690608 RepID=A0AAV9P444_9PEZI|nr:hypothetical protein LTR77_008850 [Saxophila tyrrhenica]
MDLDSLRNKRLKLFDPLATNEDMPLTTPGMVTPDYITHDERSARELQKQIEHEERLVKKTHPPENIDMDSHYMPFPDFEGNQLPDHAPQTHNHQQVPDAYPTTNGPSWGALNSFGQKASNVPPNPALEYWMPANPNALNEAASFLTPHVGPSSGPTLFPSHPNQPPPQYPNAHSDALQQAYAERRKRLPKLERPPLTYVTADAVDRSDDAIVVRQFARPIAEMNCRRCHGARSLDEKKLVAQFDSLFDGSCEGSLSFLLTCETCQSKTCMGCGVTLGTDNFEYGATTEKGLHFTWHCDAGRLALVWLILTGYDNRAKHNKPVETTSRKQLPAPQPRNRSIYGAHHHRGRGHGGGTMARGVGYAPDDDYMYDGFGDDDFEYPQASAFTGTGVSVDGTVTATPTRGRNTSTSRTVDPDDALTAQVMPALAAILPSRTALFPTAFDIDPPRYLSSMLSRSSILDKAAELLRNDSLEDATKRGGLYGSLLDLIRVLATGSRMTAEILHSERTINKAGHDLLKVSYGLPSRMKNERPDTAAPIIQSMTNVTSQSNMMLRNASANQEVFETEEAQQLIILCTNVINCSEVLQQSTPRRSAKGKAKEPETVDKDAWQRELAVLEVPDEEILAVHYSSKAAKNCKTTQTGRMRHLIKEITSMQTSLPPGIFVRHGESRLDVMKVLIVGPKDTPYENGLFEFDLFCPANYPNEPPQMHIKTTGGGKQRFNPNLYADGKVCLSLLNTWQGQRWTPGQSTILQILVSIQAMVFCDEPHCNEPGFERDVGSDLSKNYNRGLYPAVIKYAMLEWLEGARTVTPASYRHRLHIEDAPEDSEDDVEKQQDDMGDMNQQMYAEMEALAKAKHTEIDAIKSAQMDSLAKAQHTGLDDLKSAHMGALDALAKAKHTGLGDVEHAEVDVQAKAQHTETDSHKNAQMDSAANAKHTGWFKYAETEALASQHILAKAQQALATHQSGAMVNPRRIKPEPPPVDKSNMWAPVVKKHFENKHEEILETVCQWINDKAPLGRGKGRRLGTAGEGSEVQTKVTKPADFKAKNKELAKQLEAALKELPLGGRPGRSGWTAGMTAFAADDGAW